MTRLACLLAALALLAGCGGGGGEPPPNRPPTASFTATPDGGPPPLMVTLDASAARDGDGTITACDWDLGAGAALSGQRVEHTYAEAGRYAIRLTVTDDDGATASASEEIVVNAPPTARITADPVAGEAPFTVAVDATLSADADGEIASYTWDLAGMAQADGATAGHTFEAPGVYPVRLTVTDDLGGTDEAVLEVNVREPGTRADPTRFPTWRRTPMPTCFSDAPIPRTSRPTSRRKRACWPSCPSLGPNGLTPRWTT